VKDELLTILRDREKGIAAFRKAADKLARVLAEEMEDKLHEDGVSAEEIMIVPILRSGIVFVSPFEDKFKGVPVGMIGVKRNEKTAEPKLYYKNFPKHVPPVVVIVDPMLATGGSVSVTVEALLKNGTEATNIYFLGIIAAKEGRNRLAKSIPRENIILGAVDSELDAKKFIVPGLGDFGDRYFGT